MIKMVTCMLHVFYHNSFKMINLIFYHFQKLKKTVLVLELIPQLGIYPKEIFQQEVERICHSTTTNTGNVLLTQQ